MTDNKFTRNETPDDCFTVSCSGEVGTTRAFFLEGQWFDAKAEPNVKPISPPWFWNHLE